MAEHQIFHLAPAEVRTWPLDVILYGVLLVVLGTLILTKATVSSLRNASLNLEQGTLRIESWPYGRIIALADLNLQAARVVDFATEPGLRLHLRTNGMSWGRLNGGWFKLENGEKALAFLTDLRSVVYVPTCSGYSLLVSPTDPAEFLEALRRVE